MTENVASVSGEDWRSPPAEYQLWGQEIQVWRVSLLASDLIIQQYWQLLAADERTRADRFRFDKHRDRFIVGRGVLRILLGRYLHLPADRLHFGYGDRGKPYLMHLEADQKLEFNLSHSEDLALVAIAPCQVGIDIELIRPLVDAESLAQRFFAAREFTAINGLPGSEQQAAFFRYWTCKEAYLKAVGTGLADELDQVEIDFTGAIAQLKLSDRVQTSQNWLLRELHPDRNHAAALVAEGQNWRINCWQWQSEATCLEPYADA